VASNIKLFFGRSLFPAAIVDREEGGDDHDHDHDHGYMVPVPHGNSCRGTLQGEPRFAANDQERLAGKRQEPIG